MLDASLLPLDDDLARLRALEPADGPAYAAGAEDAAVRAFAHLPEPHYTPAMVAELAEGSARAGLDRGDLAVLTIADPTSDAFLGSLVLFDVTEHDAEVGFWLAPGSRGRGLATTALELAEGFAASSGIDTLTARTVTDNAASIRVLEAAGFTETSRGEDTAPSGERIDAVHFDVRCTDRKYPFLDLPVRAGDLTLRAHRDDDLWWLHRLYSRDEVARFLLEEPWTMADTRRRLARRRRDTGLERASGTLALVIEDAGVPVGDVSLWLTDRAHRLGEVGWVLDPAYGGRGVATTAVAVLLDVAFDHYGLHRVAAQADARNAASERLAERVGMHREALLRQNWWSKGEYTDTVVFGMLAGDRDPRAAGLAS